MPSFLYVSHDVGHLASGRPICHGEVVEADDLVDADQRLIELSHLLPIEPPARKRRAKDQQPASAP